MPIAMPMTIAARMPTAMSPSLVSMSLSATVPASVMVEGMERSTLPGPKVMTNICPSPTMIEKAAKVRAAWLRPMLEAPAVKRTVTTHTPAAATNDQIHGGEDCPQRRHHRAASRFAAVENQAQGQDNDENRALRADLPIGRDLEERQEGCRESEGQRADHGADRRDPSANELTATQDHAGD